MQSSPSAGFLLSQAQPWLLIQTLLAGPQPELTVLTLLSASLVLGPVLGSQCLWLHSVPPHKLCCSLQLPAQFPSPGSVNWQVFFFCFPVFWTNQCQLLDHASVCAGKSPPFPSRVPATAFGDDGWPALCPGKLVPPTLVSSLWNRGCGCSPLTHVHTWSYLRNSCSLTTTLFVDVL